MLIFLLYSVLSSPKTSWHFFRQVQYIYAHVGHEFTFLFSPDLQAVLCEQRVVVVSDDLLKIVQVLEATLALMFPLVWCHTYIPILPGDTKYNKRIFSHSHLNRMPKWFFFRGSS